MNYRIGQKVNVERVVIYAGNEIGGRLQGSIRIISAVMTSDHGTLVQFKGSKVWFTANTEYFESRNRRYRNLDWTQETT